MAERVAAARAVQRARYAGMGIATNSEAPVEAIRDGFALEALSLAESAAERLALSSRGFTRALRVARSIADLAGAETVARAHAAEALGYRMRKPAAG